MTRRLMRPSRTRSAAVRRLTDGHESIVIDLDAWRAGKLEAKRARAPGRRPPKPGDATADGARVPLQESSGLHELGGARQVLAVSRKQFGGDADTPAA